MRNRSSSSTVICPVIAHSSLTRSPEATTSSRSTVHPTAARTSAASGPPARRAVASPGPIAPNARARRRSGRPSRIPNEANTPAAAPERRAPTPARRRAEPPASSRRRHRARTEASPGPHEIAEPQLQRLDAGEHAREPLLRALRLLLRIGWRRIGVFSARCFFRSADSFRLPSHSVTQSGGVPAGTRSGDSAARNSSPSECLHGNLRLGHEHFATRSSSATRT